MPTDSQVIKTQEIIFDRLLQDVSSWMLLAPVAFAFAVVFLVIFYRQQESLSGLLKSVFIPPKAITVLALVWAFWLLLYVILGIWLGFHTDSTKPAAVAFRDQFLIWGLVPLVAYPVILGVLATAIICVKHPSRFVPLVVVALLSTLYLIAAYTLVVAPANKPWFSWLVVLGPVLFVALIYVAMMYRQDSQTVHPLWATFLGFLRCCVYATLAFLFLMPGCQSFDTKVTESKVLVLVDISGSMNRIDHLPKVGQEANADKLPSRLKDTIDEITNSKVLEDIAKVSPVTVCVFGARLDDYDVLHLNVGEKLAPEDLAKFLTKDRTKTVAPEMLNGKELDKEERDKLDLKLKNLYDGFTSATNVSGSALQALLKEATSNVQSIIIFSDGQSNVATADSVSELMTRANNPKKSTHIITVCVGNYIEPKSIRLEEIQAPIQARPDDKFYVQVPVFADGIPPRDFDVVLEAEQVVKEGDKWVPKSGGVKTTLTEKGKFKAEGKYVMDKVKFEIDVRKFKNIGPKDDTRDEEIMGFWQFTAKVARDPEETYDKGEHVSKPAQTLVTKKKLRVLLFAGGPSREYQFLRTLLYREFQESRLELAIYLQTGKEDNVNQDVDKDRLLTQFPEVLAKPVAKEKKQYDLANYDVIVAIDPDWTELSKEQIDNVNSWVNKTWAGGLIFVAGPINTYQLARGDAALKKDLTPIKEMLPVVLKDSRLATMGIELDPSRPYMLNIKPLASKYDFMKLTEKEDAKESWDDFFWEDVKDHKGAPLNGFYSYYPVEKVGPGGQVLATFDRPGNNPLINDPNLKEPPFIALQKVGKGNVLYLGSPEFCKLRMVDEDYHKRFWIQSLRWAGSGTQNLINENGVILAAQKAPVGIVSLEAQLMKAAKEPLSQDAPVQISVTMLEGADKDKAQFKPIDLKPRTDNLWTGWFQGEVNLQKPGKYRLSIGIPGTDKDVEHTVTIFRPDPETDNPRPNHDHLYELSTNAMPVLKQIDKKYVEQLETALRKNEKVSKEKKDQYQQEGKDELRLCFELSNTGLVGHCLTKVPPTEESIKGGMSYLMDRGFASDLALRTDHMLMAIVGSVGGLVVIILFLTRRWVLAAAVLAGALLIIGAIFMINVVAAPTWETFPINVSFVLIGIAGLLCIEWLTRKLLRLA